MEFLLGTFYFNQPMKKVVNLPHRQCKIKMWSIDADVLPVPKTKICHFVERNIEKYIK
jgi:hypothetical protein